MNITKLIYVMIPTYNEAGNIEDLITEILSLSIPDHQLRVLIVDDNSPDGTAKIIQRMSEKDSRVELILRTTGRGRGSAGIVGFKESLKRGADYVVEMDGDFSHAPKYIPDLIHACTQGADLVLGSRFIPGGKDIDRGFHRQLISKAAGVYTRSLLELNVKDVSSGYRCFSKKVLESIALDHMISTGPSIVSEALYKTSVKGFKIAEVPIVFVDRKEGETKLNFKTLLKTAWMVLKFKNLNRKGTLFTS